VRLLDAVPLPQSTSQGGPVPPGTPSQTASPAQILADQMTNSPATGMVPTSSGDAGAHAVTAPQFMTPAAAARAQWLAARTAPPPMPQDQEGKWAGPGQNLADRLTVQGPAGVARSPVPIPSPGGPWAATTPNAGPPMGPYGPTIRPPFAPVPPVQVFPQPPQSGTSAVDAATLEYLRQQMQQNQNNSPDYGSYAGAY